MFKKLMKYLTNNLGLKLLSILFSVVLWLVVVKLADPDGTKTFSIPVNIKNKDVIEQMGKVPDVIGDTDIATFYITGPRSYVEEMDVDDFTVTADLSQVDLTGEDDVKLVRIEITPKKYEKYITVHQKTVNLQVTLEELAEKNFVISPTTTGTPAEGCAVGEVEVTPNLLAVSGPESVVSRISKVTATINVDGISSDVTDNVVPVLYDEEGNVISSDLLEINQATVSIKANILGTKSLKIQCDVTGEPAAGYEYKGLECSPQTVKVKGEAGILSTLNVIVVPSEVIDITGAIADVESIIDINDYLPEGVSLVDEEASQIAVKALVVQKESKVFSLSTEDISIDGLLEDYELIYQVSSVPITIRASAENIENFSLTNLQATIDVSGLEPGTHTVLLKLTINDERFEVMGTVGVQIIIKDKSAETENGGADAGENDDSTAGNSGTGGSSPDSTNGNTGNGR